jgi:hypothetical protein
VFFFVPFGKSSIGLAGGHKSREKESEHGPMDRQRELLNSNV